jgi:hypothetical protein
MSGKNKNNQVSSEVVKVEPIAEKKQSGNTILVLNPDGSTEIMVVDNNNHPVETTEQQEVVAEESPVVEPTEEKVIKIVVPKKVEAAKLDDYDTQLINLILGAKLRDKTIQAYDNAPSLKEDMVKDALAKQEETTLAYTSLMSKGVIMPFTPEFEQLQAVMLELHHAKQAEETAKNTDISTLAEASIKAMRDSLVRDIEALRLSVFGRESENNGKPEGSPASGKTFTWQSETTMSFWRNEKDLVIAPVSVKETSWLSFEYREEHGLQGNWFVAFDRATGKIAYKMWDVKSSSNLWFKLTSQILVEKGEEEPTKDTWGNNQTSMGSTTTEAQKAKYPVLTPEALRKLVGDKGTSFAHNVSISEEVGMDDSTALPVETTEQKESVTA